MKVIDKISCPINYNCINCKFYNPRDVNKSPFAWCELENKTDVLFNFLNNGQYYVKGVLNTVTGAVPVLKNKTDPNCCPDYDPNR